MISPSLPPSSPRPGGQAGAPAPREIRRRETSHDAAMLPAPSLRGSPRAGRVLGGPPGLEVHGESIGSSTPGGPWRPPRGPQEAPKRPKRSLTKPQSGPKRRQNTSQRLRRGLPRDPNEHARGLCPTTQARWRDGPKATRYMCMCVLRAYGRPVRPGTARSENARHKQKRQEKRETRRETSE